MSIEEWNEAEAERKIAALVAENAELDAALAESLAATEAERAKVTRWIVEARYWYARNSKRKTGIPPVIDTGIEAAPVLILGGVG